jgi:CheY-like chemotaxis protein
VEMVAVSPLQVLVADDDCDTAVSTAMVLELLGHRVKIATDGNDALTLARRGHPDIALLDLAMPGMNGYDLARSIRALQHSTPPVLVAVSGYSSPSFKLRALEAGFDWYLTKPVDDYVFEHLDLLIHEAARLRNEADSLYTRYINTSASLIATQLDFAQIMVKLASTTRNTITKQRCLSKAKRACDCISVWIHAHADRADLRRALQELVRELDHQ